MELELSLLADSANISKEGKLNILGIFDTINAASFPIQIPQIQMVLRFRADPVEAGRTYKVEIQMVDQDGKKLATMQANMAFNDPPGRGKGMPLKGDHILTLTNAVFDKAGTYEFAILINDEVRKAIPFYILQQNKSN